MQTEVPLALALCKIEEICACILCISSIFLSKVAQLAAITEAEIPPVSYTHLDVYKRQVQQIH